MIFQPDDIVTSLDLPGRWRVINMRVQYFDLEPASDAARDYAGNSFVSRHYDQLELAVLDQVRWDVTMGRRERNRTR